MENFSDLIKKRRSTRKFAGETLSQDQVIALLKAALMSPSSKRSNSWQFIAIEDKAMLKKLAGCKEESAAFIADAALAVVVLAD
ncbi:nitroreductase family protein, partial [termite gut metagenome]